MTTPANNRCTYAIFAINIQNGGGKTHLDQILLQISSNTFSKYQFLVFVSKDYKFEQFQNRNITFIVYKYWNNYVFKALYAKLILPTYLKGFNVISILFPGGSSIKLNIKTVVIHRNLLPFDKYELKRLGLNFYQLKFRILGIIQRYSLLRADETIFLTNSARKLISKRINLHSNKSHVINHGSFPYEGSFKNLDASRKGIVYLSSFFPYKNHNFVLRSYKAAINKGLNSKLILVGSGPSIYTKSIQREIKQLKLEDHVKILSNQNKVELQRLLHNSRLGIFASQCETFGQSLLDYMRCSLPILCLKYNVTEEIVGKNCIEYEGSDYKHFGSLIFESYYNLTKLNIIAYKAYKQSLKFCWDECTTQTLNLLIHTKK